MFDRNMRIVWLNRHAGEIFRLDSESVVGRSWFEVVPPMKERMTLYERSLAGESHFVEESVVPFPEGDRFFDVRYEPVRDEHGDVVGLMASGEEVTARVQLKRQLQERMAELQEANDELQDALNRHDEKDRVLIEQKDILQSVLDNIPVIMMFFDEEGRVQSINKECERALGWATDEWRSRDLFAECYPDAHQRQRVDEFLKTPTTAWVDFKTHVRDGSVREITWYNVRLVSGGCVAIGQDITERRGAEREILEIERVTQQRIGRDLHDDLGQSLVAIGYMLDQLRAELEKVTHPRHLDVARIRGHVIETMDQTRMLARDLAPVAFVADNLPESLKELASRIESIFEVACTVEVQEPVPMPDPETATHLYRIAQEAINNTTKHGMAQNIVVRLSGSGSDMRLEIADDGDGLPENVDETKGLGISLMRYRASMLGGEIKIYRNDRGGCSVEVCCPRVR